MSKRKTPQRDKPQTTIADARAAFLDSRQAQGLTPSSLRYYTQTVTKFAEYCEQSDVATLDQVTAATVRAYLVGLQRRGLAAHSVHGAARAVRAFLRFCAADGLIADAPQFAMPKLPKKVLPAFEPGDVARLLEAANERDRLIVLVLLDTGLRANELIALDGGDLDTTTGAVLVRSGKGRKMRTVYLGAKTRRELGQYWRKVGKPAAKMPVWTSLITGERLTDSGLRQLLQRLGERARVDHCHPHTFRRTFALWSLRGGMDIHTLAALMGHADIGVLRQYLALTGKDLQRAHAAAGPVDRMGKQLP
ncbi:MAG: tyrosine-type recombinase/integrase [Caldilineaceae bacterium]